MVTVYEKRGIEQGLLRAKRDDVLLVMRSQFGEPSQKLTDKVASISDHAQLALLLQRAATAANAEELLRDE